MVMVMGMARMSPRCSCPNVSPVSARCFIELICETIKAGITNTGTLSLLVIARLFCSTDD